MQLDSNDMYWVCQKVQLFILYCHRQTILLWNLPQEAALLLVSNKNLDSGRYFIYDIDNAPLAFQMERGL